MSELKKGQKVNARTMRGTRNVQGTVASVTKAPNGVWIEVTPDDKNEKPFRTRPACVSAA